MAIDVATELTRTGDYLMLLLGDPDYSESYYDTLRDRIATSNVSEMIRIIPFQRDMRPWYAACDVMLSFSERDALGMAVLEAVIAGKQVITCQSPALARGFKGLDDYVHCLRPGVTPRECAEKVTQLVERQEATIPALDPRTIAAWSADKVSSELMTVYDELAP